MNKKSVYQVGNNKKVILWCTANQISRQTFYVCGVILHLDKYNFPWQTFFWGGCLGVILHSSKYSI